MAAQLHAAYALRQLGIWLSILLLIGTGARTEVRAQETPGRALLQRSAPEGFEDLTAPRHLQVPVLFNKVQVGKVGASVDLISISFDDPSAVAALVPNVSDRASVTAALAGPLPLNARLVCGELAKAGCGQLLPEVAGVIYDSSNAAVLLFINPSLRIWAASFERLRPQDSEPALLGKTNFNISGQSDGSEPAYSLGLNAIAGLGPAHVRAQALVRNGHSDVDQLFARHINDGLEQVAGYFNAGYGSFLPPERLLGARLGTTLDDLPADTGAYDVPLIITLANPAIIDVFVGERLIASARYQAGDARIDTSSFPSGAYLVKLRIVEAGQQRIEERFFARGSAFPPLGAAQSSLAFGVRYPGAGFDQQGFEHNTPALQLSHRRRLSHRFGLGGSLYGREDAAAAEAEFGLSSGNVQWSNSILGSSSAEFAYATSVRVQAGAWRFFGDARRMLTAHDVNFFDERRFLGIREDFWQASLSANRAFGQAQLRAIALWRRDARGNESWSVQPLLDIPLSISGRRIGLRLSGDLGPDRSAIRIEFGVPAWHQNVAARAGARGQRDRERTQVSPIYEAEISDQWRLAPAVELQGNLNWRQDERESLTGSGNLRTDKGSAFLTLQSDLDHQRTTYFGNAQSGFAWTRDGLAFTPAAPGEAAIVYVNNSRLSDGPSDAFLSNTRIGTLRPQETRVQPVSAFRKAAIGMLPSRGTSLGGSSSQRREATLFPGTVAIVATQFVHVTVAFGQVVERAGTPIGGAVLTGSHGYGGSDASGYFQIDVAAEEEISVRRVDGTTCRLRLAPPPGDVSVFDAGQVTCQ